MVQMVRRFLVLASLMIWQGGFTFYAAVVVPIGAEVLGSHRKQGVITQQVTDKLNFAGLIALAIFAWELAMSSDSILWRPRWRWVNWGLLAVTLGVLFWLHARLDLLLDAERPGLLEPERFRAEHQYYLIISTVQWLAGLIGLALSLSAWRAQDARGKL